MQLPLFVIESFRRYTSKYIGPRRSFLEFSCAFLFASGFVLEIYLQGQINLGHSARVQFLLFSPPLTSPRPSYLSRINTASCKCCTSGPSPWNNYSIAYFLKKSIELFRRCTSKFNFYQIYANIHSYSSIIHSFPYIYTKHIIYYIQSACQIYASIS